MDPSNVPIRRELNLGPLLQKKSHFLFGPRQTGKTFLIRETLPGARVYDLLDSAVFLALSRDPGRIAQELPAKPPVVVIDEIQRLPSLLNEVHRLIESRGVRFLLTGSSARGLRGAGVNLLGGRAREKRLHPLSARELGDRFDLDRALDRGLLPSIYLSDDPDADLAAYTGTYLQQEVVAEGAARNVPAFSRFLRVAALCNATVVNFTRLANDAQVPRTTVYEYFRILEDTLLLAELPAWRTGRKRKPIASSKYYFFDVGVTRSLQGRRHVRGTAEYGAAFESWVHHELATWSDAVSGAPLSFWRSTSGLEVDFLVGDRTAIEAKASAHISASDLRPLKALAEEGAFPTRALVCLEERPRRVDGIDILPWRVFVDRLWSGGL